MSVGTRGVGICSLGRPLAPGVVLRVIPAWAVASLRGCALCLRGKGGCFEREACPWARLGRGGAAFGAQPSAGSGCDARSRGAELRREDLVAPAKAVGRDEAHDGRGA